jgi:hypothetical protein
MQHATYEMPDIDFDRETNMKIYSIVLDLQKLQHDLPAQIDRQQPVLFEDAHGRVAPFHVEFIISFEVRFIDSGDTISLVTKS